MTNWTNVLIGAAVLALVVYYLRSPTEGFEDLPAGGLIGLILFILFICLGFFAIFTSK